MDEIFPHSRCLSGRASSSFRHVYPFILIPLFVACSSSPRFVERGGGSSPGRTSESKTPSEQPRSVPSQAGKVLLTLEGIASYYADDFHGKQAANGENFDMNDLTAAHRTFPFGTRIRVTNLANKKSIIVRVNDRGPYVDGRLIDLSLAAARSIELIQSGTAKVRLEVVQWGDGALYHRK